MCKATYAPPPSKSHTRQPINPGLLTCQKPYLNPVSTGNAFSSSLSNSQMNLFPLNNRPNATPSIGDSGLTLSSILNNQIENNFMSCFPTTTGNRGVKFLCSQILLRFIINFKGILILIKYPTCKIVTKNDNISY